MHSASYVRPRTVQPALPALRSGMAYTQREVELIECLFQGYRVLGFDTDGDRTGMAMLSHTGLGGHNLEAFIEIMNAAFTETRDALDAAMLELGDG